MNAMEMMDPGQYNKRYHRYLVEFMGFKDGVFYDKMQEFTEDELNAIVPDDIKKWMQKRFSVFQMVKSLERARNF